MAPKTMNEDAKPAAEMQGGARVETVEVKPVAGDPAPDGIEVITTKPGTLGAGGIVPAGSKVTVSEEQYSANWMQPATKAAAARVQAISEAKK